MDLGRRINLYADYFAKAKVERAAMRRFEIEMEDAGRELVEECFEYNGYIHRYNTYVDGVMRHWIGLNELGLMRGNPPIEKMDILVDHAYEDDAV